MNNGIFTTSTSAGFLPPTVVNNDDSNGNKQILTMKMMVFRCDSNGNDDDGKKQNKHWRLQSLAQNFNLLPEKLTYPLKINGWKMTCPFEMVPFSGSTFVHFRGCRISQKNGAKVVNIFLGRFFFGLSLPHLSGLHRIVGILEHEPGRR